MIIVYIYIYISKNTPRRSFLIIEHYIVLVPMCAGRAEVKKYKYNYLILESV